MENIELSKGYVFNIKVLNDMFDTGDILEAPLGTQAKVLGNWYPRHALRRVQRSINNHTPSRYTKGDQTYRVELL